MKAIRWILVIIAVVSWFSYGCGRDSRERDARTRAQAEQRWRSQISAIASKWQAEPNWKSRLKHREDLGTFYSAEINRALLERPGERFLFVGTIEDVMPSQDGKYRVLVGPAFSDFDPPLLFLDLTCAGDVVRPLLEAEDRSAEKEYAVIASLNHIRRRLVLSPKPDGGEARIDVANEHVGVGDCLSFVPVEFGR
jgi:hypothetical protein